MKRNYWILALLLAATAACDRTDDFVDDRIADNQPPPSAFDNGQGDFTRYIALGNSLTAGFMDNALYNDGQMNSFPNILATQLGKAQEGIMFNQPDINAPIGCSNLSDGCTQGRFILNTETRAPEALTNGEPITAFGGNKSELNNFGVPGSFVGSLLTPLSGGPAEGNPAFNPFYQRFASNPGTSTILGDAIDRDPTFFTLWIGSNDVLAYSTGGASQPELFTDPATFQAQYDAVIDSLMMRTDAGGVVLNIPVGITTLPFFRLVPYNALAIEEEALITTLNTQFGGFNNALDGLVGQSLLDEADANGRKVSFAVGANPVLIFDEDLPSLAGGFDALLGAGAIDAATREGLRPFEQARPAQPTDLLTLRARLAINQPLDGNPLALQGVTVPLGDNFVLTPEEQQAIAERATMLNGVIQASIDRYSADNRMVLINVNDIFNDLAGIASADDTPGLVVEGLTLTPDFTPNGFYSTDGIHPNPQGHVVMANAVIGGIRKLYSEAIIPEASISNFRGVIFN